MFKNTRSFRRLAGLFCLLLMACSSRNLHYDPAKPHHTPTGFRNASPDFSLPPLVDLLRWNIERFLEPAVVHDLSKIPRTPPDMAFLQANRTVNSVTWIGHATVLVQTGGQNLLTDPQFSERASPLSWIGPRRHVLPAMDLLALPPIDVVLISHNHYDHLDEASIAALEKHSAPVYLVPLGVEQWFAEQGIPAHRVKSLDWWQGWKAAGIEVFLTPAQHWSKRNLGDTQATLWGGWVIHGQSSAHHAFRFFFAGDTGYSPEYAEQLHEIRVRYGPFDVAALPIGAYEPRWFMRKQHVNPEDAVQMYRDLGRPWSFGVHWGSFAMSSEPLHQPPADLALARERHAVPEAAFSILPMGETRQWP